MAFNELDAITRNLVYLITFLVFIILVMTIYRKVKSLSRPKKKAKVTTNSNNSNTTTTPSNTTATTAEENISDNTKDTKVE